MELSLGEYKSIVDQCQILIWRSNTETLCDYFNSSWLEFTGRTIEQELGHGWAEGVHPDDFDRCLKIYLDNFKERQSFVMEYRLKRHDGVYRWIYDKGVPYYNDNGEFKGYIGSCFDINETHEYQKEIKSRLEEKNILLKEIHHRVKNNLQIITSLMSIQSINVENSELKLLYDGTKSRINAIAMVHEILHQSDNLAKLELSDYLNKLVTDLISSLGNEKNIKLNFSCPTIKLDSDTATSLGIIVNEVITNAIKYGTSDNGNTELSILLKELEPSKFLLEIGDNGNGFKNDYSLVKNDSLGINLIHGLAKQLNGKIELNPSLKGVNYNLFFQVNKNLTSQNL